MQTLHNSCSAWLGRCHLFVDSFTRDTLLAHDRRASGRVASARHLAVCGDVSPMGRREQKLHEVLRLGAKTCDGPDTDIGHELEHISNICKCIWLTDRISLVIVQGHEIGGATSH